MQPAGIGSVSVLFDPSASPGGRVAVRSSRGPMVARLLAGKAPGEELYGLVGLIYALCPAAQQGSLRAAVAAAEGRKIEAHEIVLAAQAEAMLEHLRLFLMDLPLALGLAPFAEARAIGALRAKLAALTRGAGSAKELTLEIAALARTSILAGLPEEAEPKTLSKMLCRAAEWASPAARSLFERALTIHDRSAADVPLLDTESPEVRAELSSLVWTEGFTERPHLSCGPCQTHALARHAALVPQEALPLPALLFARLLELAMLSLGMPQEGWLRTERDNCRALSIMQCARGSLVTAVEMRRGLIERAVIVAPTEWNFHPQGAASRLLNTIPARSFAEFEQKARRSLLLLDACIPYTITEKQAHA